MHRAMHILEVYTCVMHVYEVQAHRCTLVRYCLRDAGDAYNVHAYKTHAREIHAYEMHAQHARP
jgi:hypothetical protein